MRITVTKEFTEFDYPFNVEQLRDVLEDKENRLDYHVVIISPHGENLTVEKIEIVGSEVNIYAQY